MVDSSHGELSTFKGWFAGRIDSRKTVFHCWAVAKLVRHQALDLAFEGSNPSRPAILVPDAVITLSTMRDADGEHWGGRYSRRSGGLEHV